ncbi:MAG TPA: orotate phosphoribosyltransferase [Candidatus Cloacimonadota bacterium]|nr:orotate phosphoribosyltransferase [Candidatus Cloacimonadota bacterium]
MEEQLVTIATYDNVFEAELAKALLEESGFEVFIQNERIMGIYPTIAADLYRIELQVADSVETEAAAILESLSDENYALGVLEDMGALLEGHFLLTSGKHSGKYIEKIKLIQKPEYASQLCKKIAMRLEKYAPDAIVGPAYGGIALAFEVARYLEKDFLFTQRKEEAMTLRSGFDLSKIKKVVIVEDIVTTGGSVFEVIDCLKSRGVEVVAVAALVDRSGSKVDFGVPFEALATLDIPTWEADACELCAKDIPLVKPGASDKKPS